MKKILIIVSIKPSNPEASNNWGLFRDSLRSLLGGGARISITALDQLVYIAGRDSKVYDYYQDFDIADFDFVIFRKIGDNKELAIAAAHYLQQHGIPFIDRYILTQGRGKLGSAFAMQASLPVPRTVFAQGAILKQLIASGGYSMPLVLKANIGRKGNDNYLIHTLDELSNALANTVDKEMLIQEYIPNDGDYRLLVLGGKVRLVMRRRSASGGYLNNTSKGGSAELVDPVSLSDKILDESVQAAVSEKLQVAGVDLIFDKNSGEHYFLEVNQAPQIPTGSFTDEKMYEYSEMIKELTKL